MKIEFGIVIPKVFQYLMWLGLALMTTGIVVHGEILRRGESLFVWLVLVLYSKF